MANANGYWTFDAQTESGEPITLSGDDLIRIAALIIQGETEGEIIQED